MSWKLITLASAWLTLFGFWVVSFFVYRTPLPKRHDKNWSLFLMSVISITVLIEYLSADYLLKRFEMPILLNYIMNILGIALLLSGLSFAIWARITLGYFWSGSVAFIENQPIVKNGPYRIVRHPIYSGVIAMLWGSFLLVRIGILFFIAVSGTIIMLWKARLEESLLGKCKDEEYISYKKEVPGIF